MKKIGVFGGTFDPVHLGHIHLAKQAMAECHLDGLIIMPVKIQPFKIGQATANAVHRLAMTKLAFEEDPRILISDFELSQEGVSYTVLTLRAMKKQFPDADIAFVMGTDAFLKVETWWEAEELLRGYSFIVGRRPGYKDHEVDVCIKKLEDAYHADIRTIHNRQLSISSTEIKQRLRAGKCCSQMVPETVERYMIDNGLYQEIH